MKNIWVVVADEAIARILQCQQGSDDLESVEEITDAAARADTADLRRDAQGRRAGGSPPATAQSHGPRGLRGTASVTASAADAEKHQEAAQFAHRVAERLAEGLQKKHFDELRIAAAPRFLGLLRKALSPQLAALVTEEWDKDLVKLDKRELRQRLFHAQAGA